MSPSITLLRVSDRSTAPVGILINDQRANERMAIGGSPALSFLRGPLIREIRLVSVGVRYLSFVFPPYPPPSSVLFLRPLRGTAGSFFQSMSINLDLGSSPPRPLLRILFFRRACTAGSSSAKGRKECIIIHQGLCLIPAR